MLKRTLVLFLCTCLVFVAAACGSDEDDQNSSVEIYSSVTEPVIDENGVPKLAGTNKYTDPSIYTIDTLVSMGVEK